jgi:hypothetical protein
MHWGKGGRRRRRKWQIILEKVILIPRGNIPHIIYPIQLPRCPLEC